MSTLFSCPLLLAISVDTTYTCSLDFALVGFGLEHANKLRANMSLIEIIVVVALLICLGAIITIIIICVFISTFAWS